MPKSHILKLKSRGQKTSESNGSLYVHMLCEETYMAREERANWRISAGRGETIIIIISSDATGTELTHYDAF